MALLLCVHFYFVFECIDYIFVVRISSDTINNNIILFIVRIFTATMISKYTTCCENLYCYYDQYIYNLL